MDFFTAQERSRRQTRFLIFLFLLATLAVTAGVTAIVGVAFYGATFSNVAPPDSFLNDRSGVLLYTAIGTLIFIACASLFRIATLRAGGSRVARELGGTLVSGTAHDPLQRRLLNVVEEMAIASGVPVPEVYLLENEGGINAFAAGFHPEDAVVAVTRGTLERLNRDELQGVIGHEFSHILNGDMRLNIRLMGPMFGILALGLIGRMMTRSARRTRLSSGGSRSTGGNAAAYVLIGVGLMVVGYIGLLLARLIKAGVSRQREYLADASAVQFTRQPAGIADALKKIAGFQEKSFLRSADAEEISHMLFATGASRLTNLFATHPPLLDRIRKLDPQFTPESLQRIQTDQQVMPDSPHIAGLAGPGSDLTISERFTISPEQVADSVGNPDPDDVRVAQDIYQRLPDDLIEAAHSSADALLLALALILHTDDGTRRRQLQILRDQLGARRTERCAEQWEKANALGARFRLPLLDLLFPALRRRPGNQLDFLLQLMRRLIDADFRIELFEYCIARTLEFSIARMRAPDMDRRRRRPRYGKSAIRTAVFNSFGIFALHGHEKHGTAGAAFVAGIERIDARLVPQDPSAIIASLADADWISKLDAALLVLREFAPTHQRKLVEALTVTASHDAIITIAESELLRVFCAALDCPMPPLYGQQSMAG